MKITLIGLFAVIVGINASILPLAPTTTLLRTPQYDSAYIQSDRFGGNFAYSTAEGHAYQQLSPVYRNVIRPVAYSYPLNSYPFVYHAPQPLILPQLQQLPQYQQLPQLPQLSPFQPIPTIQYVEPKPIEELNRGDESKNNDNSNDSITVEAA